MTKRRDPNPEFDFFIPLMNDLPLKDQREVMERPFFSLQKRKRLKPIEYRSPDGEAWVKVEAMPAYGMATIWDADILIWAASVLNRMKEQGVNDLPRTLTTTTYDLLRGIRRGRAGATIRVAGRPVASGNDLHSHVAARAQAPHRGAIRVAGRVDVGGGPGHRSRAA
jgi:plasmid replication initiation protein